MKRSCININLKKDEILIKINEDSEQKEIIEALRKKLPDLKTSIFDYGFQLFDSVYEGLYNNDKISSEDKKKVFQYIQSNILIRAQKYTAFLSLFYTDLSKTLNDVFKSIHSFNEENIK